MVFRNALARSRSLTSTSPCDLTTRPHSFGSRDSPSRAPFPAKSSSHLHTRSRLERLLQLPVPGMWLSETTLKTASSCIRPSPTSPNLKGMSNVRLFRLSSLIITISSSTCSSFRIGWYNCCQLRRRFLSNTSVTTSSSWASSPSVLAYALTTRALSNNVTSNGAKRTYQARCCKLLTRLSMSVLRTL